VTTDAAHVAIAFFFSLKKVCAIWFSPCLRALSRAADLRIEELLMLRARHSFFVGFYWE
jgi:hypothetical protein